MHWGLVLVLKLDFFLNRLNYSVDYGILLDQGLNRCPLHCKADSCHWATRGILEPCFDSEVSMGKGYWNFLGID